MTDQVLFDFELTQLQETGEIIVSILPTEDLAFWVPMLTEQVDSSLGFYPQILRMNAHNTYRVKHPEKT